MTARQYQHGSASARHPSPRTGHWVLMLMALVGCGGSGMTAKGSGGASSVGGSPSSGGASASATDASTGGGSGGVDRATTVGSSGSTDAAATGCSGALPISCGEVVNHSTLIEGRRSVWDGYPTTARGLTGPETLYVFSSAGACQVTATLSELTVDLDLLLLTDCTPAANTRSSSTPLDLQTVETVRFTAKGSQTYLLVVDGYASAAGSYTLEIDCACSK